MRLKSISLAGFKSFVDPTKVTLPSNMCAVVGPNGCGKSNIIDAVRWVMGESSAKTLRGESMSDVIFNGTTHRQPVGQASIELLFDNSTGKVGGEYAAYSEISVRRLVTREGTSDYFLNGNKCRRRDITDLFLGTGLGPRSYAIIEQGMISRLIESRPEDLRVYIEEAAGISKYKERRRETENRMQRTLDNLDRLTDLREELERNLGHLKRQAQAAERYALYKTEERGLKAQLLVLQRQVQAGVESRAQREIDEFATEKERYQSQVSASVADIELLRQSITEANASTGELQGSFYSLGSEVSQIEQSINFAKQRRETLAKDLEQTLQGKQRELGLMDSDSQRLEELFEALTSIEPTLAREREEVGRVDKSLQDAEKIAATADGDWDSFTQRAAVPRQQVEVQQGRQANAERNLVTLTERLSRIETELEQLGRAGDDQDVDSMSDALQAAQAGVTSVKENLDELKNALGESRVKLETLRQQQDELRRQAQALSGQRASLEALQSDAREENGGQSATDWLGAQGVEKQGVVLDAISVDAGYEAAADLVLGDWLSAFRAELAAFDSLDTEPSSGLRLVDLASARRSTEPSMLAHYVDAPEAVQHVLAEVHVVEDWRAALAQRSTLSDGASIVSKDGLWVSKRWIRTRSEADAEQGIIARQARLSGIVEAFDRVAAELSTTDVAISEHQALRSETEQSIDAAQESMQVAQHEASRLDAQKRALLAQREQRQAREAQLHQDRSDLEVRGAEEQAVIAQAVQMLGRAKMQVESDESVRSELESARETAREHVRQSRQAKQQADVALNRSEVRNRELLTQQEALRQSIERAKQQVLSYEEREAAIRGEMPTDENPDLEAQQVLSQLLEKRLGVEAQLTQARQGLSELETTLRNREQARMAAEQSVAGVQTRSEGARLKLAETGVRLEQIDRALAELDADMAAVEADLPEDAEETEWLVRVERIGAKIHRLGPINLAAIDETTRAKERKEYLDAQDNDLRTALETLQNAIKKIDKETRSRFKETFDTVNAGFSELFPKVFGGGTAFLEMTGDDLLDTGVSIMARPPGKKNSTIHLLSGGEKAMTAIALVFSIFQLNPAPFCMLDEVDAPLDDANVGRYARLVSEMSKKVQFVFITHNKITMEAAEQLMGVTMHEPGVSRLVTVDIEEAARLAAS
ncbi:chromosome segregation protein SMC [Luminiphilus sp.]|nr:chromosome segregation protein SMC [Luminiphilus sp.]